VKILEDLIGSLRGDAPAREVRVGRFWTAVLSRGCGLASTVGPEVHEHGAVCVGEAGRLAGRSALELTGLAHSESTLEAGIGLAAINLGRPLPDPLATPLSGPHRQREEKLQKPSRTFSFWLAVSSSPKKDRRSSR